MVQFKLTIGFFVFNNIIFHKSITNYIYLRCVELNFNYLLFIVQNKCEPKLCKDKLLSSKCWILYINVVLHPIRTSLSLELL